MEFANNAGKRNNSTDDDELDNLHLNAKGLFIKLNFNEPDDGNEFNGIKINLPQRFTDYRNNGGYLDRIIAVVHAEQEDEL